MRLVWLVAAACGKSGGEAAPRAQPQVPRDAADVTCTAALTAAYAVIGKSIDGEIRDLTEHPPLAMAIDRCALGSWPLAMRACLAGATTTEEIFHACYGLAFDRPIEVKRTFTAEDPDVISSASPGALDSHGDYLRLVPHCGVVFQSSLSIKGLFLVCDGQTRGPLTLVREITRAFDIAAYPAAERHDAIVALFAKTPRR